MKIIWKWLKSSLSIVDIKPEIQIVTEVHSQVAKEPINRTIHRTSKSLRRSDMRGNEFLGAVGEASNGSRGIIVKHTEHPDYPDGVWVGVSFNGRAWSSRHPKIIAYSLREYVKENSEIKITDERKAYLEAIRRIRGQHGEDGKRMTDDIATLINERGAARREDRKYLHRQLTEELSDDKPETVELISKVLKEGKHRTVEDVFNAEFEDNTIMEPVGDVQ